MFFMFAGFCLSSEHGLILIRIMFMSEVFGFVMEVLGSSKLEWSIYCYKNNVNCFKKWLSDWEFFLYKLVVNKKLFIAVFHKCIQLYHISEADACYCWHYPSLTFISLDYNVILKDKQINLINAWDLPQMVQQKLLSICDVISEKSLELGEMILRDEKGLSYVYISVPRHHETSG